MAVQVDYDKAAGRGQSPAAMAVAVAAAGMAVFIPPTSADIATAVQAAWDDGKGVLLGAGTYTMSAATASLLGLYLRGVGHGDHGTVIQRADDSPAGAMIAVAAGGVAEGFELADCKIREESSAYTNTKPLVQIGANDYTIRDCWFFYGYQQIKLTQAASDGTILGNIFESARKNGLYGYSAPLLKIIGNTFWKGASSTSDSTNRGAHIQLMKDAGYDFGCADTTIVGNYFLEAVYGHHVHIEGADGVSITGNFFSVASQVDSGQRDDIYLKNSSRVVVTGNTSNKLFNSYAPGVRGSRYVVNIDSGCSDIAVGPNAFEAGVSGTVYDPNNSATVIGIPGVPNQLRNGLKVGNTVSADANTLDWVERGSWTPILKFGGATTGITYSVQTGSYARFGNMVAVSCSIVLSNKGSASGNASIAGFPFTSAATPCGWIIETDGGITLTGQLMIYTGGNGTEFGLYSQNNGSLGLLADTAFSNSSVIRFSFIYLV